jgi:hypothetical protein
MERAAMKPIEAKALRAAVIIIISPEESPTTL